MAAEPERPSNYARNAYHLASAVGLLVLVRTLLATPEARVAVAAAAAAAAWGMEAGRRASPGVNRFLMRLFAPVAHPDEAEHVNSATWYTTAVCVLAVAYPLEAGVAAVAVLGAGDPAAAVVGRRFGRHRLADGRSLEGAVAFVAVGTLAAFVALVGFGAAPGPAVAVGAAAAIAGAGAELVSRRVDDNLSIPLAAGLAAVLAGQLVGYGG